MKLLGLAVSLFVSLSVFAAKSAARKSDDDITFVFAKHRKAQIKEVSYKLHFELMKGKDEFKGVTEINVSLNTKEKALSLDSHIAKIEKVVVNGQVISGFPTRLGSFDIPAKSLALENIIVITYTGNYSKDSGGFLKSVDPEDKSEYVYTDFEPYYAHKLFPCFDQPDLKATYSITVSAPKDWTVIHNELIYSAKTENDSTLTTFKTTPKISTYLFFLGAGPFVEWKDQAGKTPLYLYARKTLAKYVDHEEIFKTTKAGLKFFNDYFKYEYPFSKYGQIFIPEFAWGGMENPGAVTLNEKNIFRGPVPRSRYEGRDDLILHEMAHMWFGDLVTMEWWNDLWLNESFASYLASVAQEKALGSKATWMSFFNTKTWGYWQDQLVTTHPIETDVPDIRTAKGNFDGITYAKGASALKQLHYFVGEEGFREGLRAYFKKYAWQNTQRQDFIGSIAEASKTDLNEWTKKWLQTAGLNRVMVNFECKDSKVTDATLIQKASVSKTLSPHRTQLGLYKIDGDELDLTDTIDVTYNEAKTPLISLVGKKCPDFILPNQNDQDFALFSFDKNSIQHAKLALITLPDSLSRIMTWSVLNQMVRDRELRPLDYMELAMAGLEKEKDDLLAGTILGRHSSIPVVYQGYLTQKEREFLAPRFEEVLWKRIISAEAGSSLQMAFFDFYVGQAQTKMGIAKLHKMLTTNQPPKGIVLDQDRRWAVLMSIATAGHPESKTLIAAEQKADNTTNGKRMGFAAESAFPDQASKAEMWKELTTKEHPYSIFREAAGKFHGSNQATLTKEFVDPFFKKVTTMDWKTNDSVVDIYFDKLFPGNQCNETVLKLSQQKLKTAKNLTNLARRSWLEAQDELDRCVQVRSGLNIVKDYNE